MIFRASLLDAPQGDNLRFVEDGLVVIDGKGRIERTGRASDLLSDTLLEHHEVLEFTADSRPVCVPGLVDIHTHLPQYPVVARRERSLLPWLERHIFPQELEFQGPGQRLLIEAFFDDLARGGTTTAVLNSAIWEDSTDLAFEIARERGLRAIIGKVMMDEGSYGQSQPPEARRRSLEETRRLIGKWHGANGGLLEFAVSPRFAVTCSGELMREAAALARESGTYVQTHLAENTDEVVTVRKRFPKARDYTGVYEDHNILSPKSLLAHAIHVSSREIEAIASSGAAIAHCPTSNLFLNSGLCPLDEHREAGIRIGLGSDVAGGPELNLWQVMRCAIETQQARAFADPSVPPLSPTGAFHLATAGGAAALGKENIIGTLDPGHDADLAIIDLNRVLPLDGRFTGALDGDQILAALVYRGGPQAALATLVQGRQVFPGTRS